MTVSKNMRLLKTFLESKKAIVLVVNTFYK